MHVRVSIHLRIEDISALIRERSKPSTQIQELCVTEVGSQQIELVQWAVDLNVDVLKICLKTSCAQRWETYYGFV